MTQNIKLDRFQPRWYQLPIFDAIENKGYRRVVAILPRRCLSGDSHITMADGSFKLLKDIQPGDQVLSWDGEQFVADTVKHAWKTEKKKTDRVRSGSSIPLITSEDHVFAHSSRHSPYALHWSRLKDIGPHRNLALYHGTYDAGKKCNERAEFLGYMLADGYVSGYQQPQFTNTNMTILRRVEHLATSLFHVDVIWREKGNGYDLGLSNKTKGGGYTPNPIKELFRQEGLDIPKKDEQFRLPQEIWKLCHESIYHFFAALISADGGIYCAKHATIKGKPVNPVCEVNINCGRSYYYAWDIYWLLRKVGIMPHVPYCERGRNWKIKVGKSKYVYSLLKHAHIWGKETRQEKAIRLLEYYYPSSVYLSTCYPHYEIRLSSYEVYEEGEEELYDIETEKYHNFVANGYLVHNSGKDLAAFNLCVRQCLRKRCVVYYILPTYAQARKTIWDSITNEGYRFLDYIPPELIQSTNQQEMKIYFINGSLLQLVGSDNYDRLVGTNPSAVVFSEYALQNPKAFDYIRPILAANKGWAVFISCVAPDTIVFTDKGMERIQNVSQSRETYSELNRPVYGKGGFHNAEQFYYGGWQPTLKITLRGGFQLECTPVHPIWDGEQWVQAQNLSVGDRIPIQYGQEAWGPGLDISDFKPRRHGLSKKVPFDLANPSRDFCYLLGLIHADGSYDDKKITITKKRDKDIIDFIHAYGFIAAKDGIHHVYHSRTFCDLLDHLGMRNTARNKQIPERMLQANKEQMKAFIQGIFDGDGTSHCNPQKRGRVKLTSTSLAFLRDLQVILLNFGVVGNIRSEYKAPTNRVAVSSTIYNIDINGYFVHVFYENIGFRLMRKQRNHCHVPVSTQQESGNIYPVDPDKLTQHVLWKSKITNPYAMTRRMLAQMHHESPDPYLAELLKEKLYFSNVISIEESENYVYDFVIPETHSFNSNGYLSHNTPRGKNHLWQLYSMAQESPDWFAYRLTVDDTQHISKEEIQKEYDEGLMSKDLIAQEYYTSFNQGIEGAYYAKYLDEMRRNDQISRVLYDPSHVVHTAWDLGVRDTTAIIFFQYIGKSIHIIETYQNNNVGLEHYIKVLLDRQYIYGKHIAPHDIKVRDYGTGMSRWDKAKSLGITFTVAPHMHVMDGIEAVRSTLPRTFIDSQNAQPVIDALENYRKEFDETKNLYKPHPLHDKYSHMADALRMLCISLSYIQEGMSTEDLRAHYQRNQQKDSDLPSFFQGNHSSFM